MDLETALTFTHGHFNQVVFAVWIPTSFVLKNLGCQLSQCFTKSETLEQKNQSVKRVLLMTALIRIVCVISVSFV